MTTARKRPTALDRAKRTIEELEDRLVISERAWQRERDEVMRLEERCGWLFEEAHAMGSAIVSLRLGAGYMSPERFAFERTGNPQSSLLRSMNATVNIMSGDLAAGRSDERKQP
jgi:hypothetical protein